MSYDYFLFARPRGEKVDFDSLASERVAIGSPEALMARIDAIFPNVTWEPPHGDVDV